MLRPLAALLLLSLTAAAAQAHKASDSYLNIRVDGASISGRWDIALRDLDFAIGLDANGDGNITWGEVRTRHADIAAYAAGRLQLSADGKPCTLAVGAQAVDEHTDGAYTVLPLRFACPGGAPARLTIGYTLFADLDPQHRGLLNLNANGSTRTAIFSPQAAQQTLDLRQASPLRQLLDYGREGVWHIWIGYDHILFLLSLLLPAVGVWTVPGLARAGGAVRSRNNAHITDVAHHSALRQRWQPVDRFGQAFWDVLRIVTAFTVAHSITLSLATLGLVALPSRLVESSIALSVVLAALNNVWPLFHRRRWMVAFAFGLLHGFGFASVLTDLGLPQGALALALLGFNLGVEGGQLSIVLVFLPLAYLVRRSAVYRHVVLLGGSLLIALIAALWLAERVFEFKLLPF